MTRRRRIALGLLCAFGLSVAGPAAAQAAGPIIPWRWGADPVVVQAAPVGDVIPGFGLLPGPIVH